jgi:hypothetical protein
MNVVGNKISHFKKKKNFFGVEMCCHIELRLSMFHFEIYNEIKRKKKKWEWYFFVNMY